MSTFDTEQATSEAVTPRFFDSTGTNPGDALLMVTSGWDLITGFEDFIAASGLDAQQVYTGIGVRPPIPLYPDPDPDPSTGRSTAWQWGPMKPEMARSPLFWLPAVLTERMPVFGEPEPEVDEDRLVSNLLLVKEHGHVSALGERGPLPMPHEDDRQWAERYGREVTFDDAFIAHLQMLSGELGIDLLSGVVLWNRHPERVETDEEWAMRIALVMQESGLYDPETGWVDVFAAHGLDLDDSMTRLDFEAWIDGAPSATFESISLDRWLGQYGGDFAWAQDVVAAQGTAVVGRAVALLSREALIKFISLAPDENDPDDGPMDFGHTGDPLSKDEAVDYALTTAEVTWGMLYRVEPDELEPGDVLFDRLIGQLRAQPDYDTMIETILPPVVGWLLEVQNAWWKWLELLNDPEAYAASDEDEDASSAPETTESRTDHE